MQIIFFLSISFLMRPEWTIFDAIFTFGMHLKWKFFMVQKDAAKEVYRYPLGQSLCMEVLTQVWKYVGKYPVPVYVYKYEGNCRCKSATAKVIMFRNNKKSFIVFKETFVLVIHRKFVKQKFTSARRRSVPQKMILNWIEVYIFYTKTYIGIWNMY